MVIGKIRVDLACATTVWAIPITAGMIGAEIEIEYVGAEWSGLTKTVVFSGAVVKDVTTDDTIVDIAPECMAMAGVMLKVGVFGFRAADKKVVIPTVEANIGRVLRGTDPSGDESTNPTLPVWAEILNIADEAKQLAQSVRDDADSGKLIGTIGPEGPKGDTGPQGPAGPAGETGPQGPAGKDGLNGADGHDGADGKDGADGYTPVKGVDYFTEDDKAELVDAVMAALPAAEEDSF